MIKVMFILTKYTQTSVEVDCVRRLSVLCYINIIIHVYIYDSYNTDFIIFFANYLDSLQRHSNVYLFRALKNVYIFSRWNVYLYNFFIKQTKLITMSFLAFYVIFS